MSTGNGQPRDGLVVCLNSQGVEFRGNLLRLAPYAAVFEIYGPGAVVRLSEVLDEFQISVGEEAIYSGRAVVSNVVNAGITLVCEAKLDEPGLQPLPSSANGNASLRHLFAGFLREWQNAYHVRPEFKEVMGDMQNFLIDLRLWLERVELQIRASPTADRCQRELSVINDIGDQIAGTIDSFIERFEDIAQQIEEQWRPVHRAYLRRQLHPLLLCSPFAYRTYCKPLGYAGDYEVVDMMIRPPAEGSTLFGKVINVWLLGQAPAHAHRNRVEYLERKLLEEALRAKSLGRIGRVYNLGCGPAAEVQRLLRAQPLADQLQFTLLDFNEETLAHVRSMLEEVKTSSGRSTELLFVKRSVQQLLKEAAKSVPRPADKQFDFVYCAGLFDYLPDPVCKRLMNIFYEMLAPGGLLVATNVSDAMNASRPFRYSMEYILDWHLIYRSGSQFRNLRPDLVPEDGCRILAEEIGVNVFLEIRKPSHG